MIVKSNEKFSVTKYNCKHQIFFVLNWRKKINLKKKINTCSRCTVNKSTLLNYKKRKRKKRIFKKKLGRLDGTSNFIWTDKEHKKKKDFFFKFLCTYMPVCNSERLCCTSCPITGNPMIKEMIYKKYTKDISEYEVGTAWDKMCPACRLLFIIT